MPSPIHPRADEEVAKITAASGSNLWYVGRLLSSPRRKLFEAAYAGMRLVDDFVDDEFLPQPPDTRDASRSGALSLIADWEAASQQAIDDGIVSADTPTRFRAAIAALAALPVNARPPARAWNALASAMRRDVREQPLERWDDFVSYCEGATVAPAAVFLHVLTIEETVGGPVARLDESALFDHARPMALFCYLVHIVRDIARDAAAPDQLLTISKDLLEKHGVTRDMIRRGDDAVGPLLMELLDRAEEYRSAGEAARRALTPYLDHREALILDALLGIYQGLHDTLREDPGAARRGEALPTGRIRRAVFKRLGLA